MASAPSGEVGRRSTTAASTASGGASGIKIQAVRSATAIRPRPATAPAAQPSTVCLAIIWPPLGRRGSGGVDGHGGGLDGVVDLAAGVQVEVADGLSDDVSSEGSALCCGGPDADLLVA